jgi:YD repeat-containing protein
LPDERQVSYAYDGAANLAQVIYPDGALRKFHYNEPELTGGVQLPNALTGITDENNSRYSRYGYAQDGRAILSEHAGGADRTSVSYTGLSSSVTDALGQSRTFNFSVLNGVGLNTAVTGSDCPACGPASQTYDTRGFRASSTDWNGNRTNFVHDARGLETQRLEGLTRTGGATSATRTITTEWHAQYRLPMRIAEPSRITTFAYGESPDTNPGNRGSLLSKTVQATNDASGSLGFSATRVGLPRTWAYTYNKKGRVLTIDGPRTDVQDITTYTYHADDATCAGASAIGCRGEVATITNALGHVTTIDEYDPHGQPSRVTDPNGLTTVLTYDARLRLASRSVGGEITAYGYDNAGQLISVALPDGASTLYTYDPAHRLVQIADTAGNSIAYTLDAAGNRIKEDVRDPLGTLARTRTRIFDGLSRLVQEIGARHQITTYVHDQQGNVTSIDGPLSGSADVTLNFYDALNRLVRVTDPSAGQVSYAYDGRDQLVSVSDQRKVTTSYTYDGLGNLTQLASPDTGITVNTHDAAGNLLTSTDASGKQVRYAYDALDRVMRVDYFSAGAVLAASHTYAYDAGTNQKGRLTGIEEPASTTSYSYDQKGRLVSESRTINGVVYASGYAYDAYGRLTGMTYPGGRQVRYGLDALGRIQTITSIKADTTQPIVANVTYQPFGGPAGFTFGNGQTYSRGFDGDGRVASYTLATQTVAVGYDSGNRIAFLSDIANPQNSNTYGYDALDRLTQFVGPSTAQGFTYDGVGNRLSKTVGTVTQSYVYANASNRLSSLMAGGDRSYTHDAAGNLTSDGLNTYAYDARGRLMQAVTSAATTHYTINSLGQRIRKSGSQGDTVYHYDDRGHLIAESTAAGVILKEYVYLGDIPVAVLQ